MSVVVNYMPPESPFLRGLVGSKCVRPETVEQLERSLVWAAEQGARLMPVAGGRKLSGPVGPGVTIMDMRGLDKIGGWDKTSLTVTAEPGVRFADLEAFVEGEGASLCGWRREHGDATVGGLLSARQLVGHNLWNGSIREACVSLSAVTGAGASYSYLIAPRKSSGPDLRHLFLGARGQFGVITSVTLGVSSAPQRRLLLSSQKMEPLEAVSILTRAFALGMRAANVLYSGAGKRIQIWLEGSRDGVDVMSVALRAAAEGRRLEEREMDAGPGEAWDEIRSGGDPVTGRGEDPRGGVEVWGHPLELATLPAEVWKKGVLYDVSAHQACLVLPHRSKGAGMVEGLRSRRAVWWAGGAVSAPADFARVGPDGLDGLKAALDPSGVLPCFDGGER